MKTLIVSFIFLGFAAQGNNKPACPHLQSGNLHSAPRYISNDAAAAKPIVNKTPIRKKGLR